MVQLEKPLMEYKDKRSAQGLWYELRLQKKRVRLLLAAGSLLVLVAFTLIKGLILSDEHNSDKSHETSKTYDATYEKMLSQLDSNDYAAKIGELSNSRTKETGLLGGGGVAELSQQHIPLHHPSHNNELLAADSQIEVKATTIQDNSKTDDTTRYSIDDTKVIATIRKGSSDSRRDYEAKLPPEPKTQELLHPKADTSLRQNPTSQRQTLHNGIETSNSIKASKLLVRDDIDDNPAVQAKYDDVKVVDRIQKS